jgi:hypothetical protein
MNRLLVVSLVSSPSYKKAARLGIEPWSPAWLVGTLNTMPNVTGWERYAAIPGFEPGSPYIQA